ncbi:MAG: alpha/beta hydrolase [Candidatus Dadabacteria bacterium]|nr:MAG: alpha/beta hydrolase [Candidatus Dadabacteria bacterium]
MSFRTRLQYRLMFPGVALDAPAIDDAALTRAGVRRWWLDDGAGGRSEAWLLAADAPTGAIIFAHGNGELIEFWPEALRFIADELNHDLLLVEYPGYGRSTGRPTGHTVRTVMRTAFDRLQQERAPQQTIGFGRSLGGGAISALATERRLDGLVLASTFTSIRDLARDLHLPAFVVENTFAPLPVVRTFPNPVLVIHGRNDELIPFRHGQRLAEGAAQGRLYADEGGHNDTPRDWNRFRHELADWLAELRGTSRGQ